MTINIFRARRERREFFRNQELELARHYRTMEIISNASKNGMK